MDTWRGPHHRQPDPEFETLCAEAERKGLQVSFDVSSQIFGKEPYEYRSLGPLIVGIPERPQLVMVPMGLGVDRSLRQASAIAREQLERI